MSIERQLQPGEEILYRAHPSRVQLLPLVALGLVLILGGFVLRGFTQNDWALYVPLALGLAALVVAGARHLALYSFEYVVTDRRVLRQTGLLGKSSMDTYLDKINNVEHRQTLWGRLLGFGDVEIDTASQVGEAVFPRISRPLDFKRAIVGAAEAYRSGRRPQAAPVAAPAGAAPASPAGAPSAQKASAADQLRELKRLLDDGLISQAEFDTKRKQLVDQL
jgi:uncharacterized membrane protein YdbT with pleckstrin-like domain